MKKKKILVVDDEEMLVDFLRIRLEANGYIVEAASDGTEGLIKIDQTHPDLVILDVFMKPMDGLTMLREMRGNDQMKDIPVIILTASGKKREVFEELGISDFVRKPFDSDDLVKRVANALKG